MLAKILLSLSLIFLIGFSPLLAAEQVLKATPLVIEKEVGNQIELVKTYLTPRAKNNKVKIWVFFTDKAVFTNEQFDQVAQTVQLTDKARERRAISGIDFITFADLPVYQQYIEQIESMGCSLRRISRWLNGASFECSLDLLDDLNQLPFAAKIRPVASFYPEKEQPAFSADKSYLAPDETHMLNYGSSFNQLNQINVPVVHDQGFNGAGIIVAMFDTGYFKDHEAFAAAFGDGRVLAEWDFVFDDGETQNEAIDHPSQHNHGTLTWSTLGGTKEGTLYGPAYGASFILAKTEDIRSETVVEEDNWAAAVEWADSIGARVISSSLSYSDWYVYSNYDGETAITTIAANLATALGIVVCNSAGNAGPGAGSIAAPVDAFEILSVGAANSNGSIASFSSRGPTADGRIKPEVTAQGVSTFCASSSGTTQYTTASGTSLSCPLIGGAAALLLSARPSFTPQLARMAMMETASQATAPDNIFGWGIVDMDAAIHWGAKMSSDVQVGWVPFEVNFFDISPVPVSSRVWDLGEGPPVTDQNPTHIYNQPGAYDVSLTITSDGWELSDSRADHIIALADTIIISSDTVYAGQQAIIDIYAVNSQPLTQLTIALDFSGGMVLFVDSISTFGTRAAGLPFTQLSQAGNVRAYKLGNGANPLLPGSGVVIRIYVKSDIFAFGGSEATIDTTTINNHSLEFASSVVNYVPFASGGNVVLIDVARGDANNDGNLNVGDPVFVITHVFREGPAPITFESGDANLDFQINAGDAVFMINFVFKGGPPPNDI